MDTKYLPKDPRAYLREELQIRKKRRPHYSLRAFARDLEMSPSSLCEFLSGRQGMSRERIMWIGRKISLSDEQVDHFCDLVETEFGRTSKDKKSAKVRVAARSKDNADRLSIEKFHFIADWYHLTLLEILSLPEKKYGTEELSEILGVSREIVKSGLQRLVNLGLIKKVGTYYEACSEATIAGDEGPSRAIQIYHEQFLQMHVDQVFKKSVDKRENISASLAIAEEDWPFLREEIKKSMIDILTKYASNNKLKNQVVCCATQAVTLIDNTYTYKTHNQKHEGLNKCQR